MEYQEKLKIDWWTVVIYLVIMFFGWLNVYAAGYSEAHSSIFDFSVQHGKQFIWIVMALALAGVILLTEPRLFSNTAYAIYGFVMGLLVLTLFLAVTVNGGKSWIDLGFFRLQPSEFAKFATALAVSKYLSALHIEMKDMRTKIVVAALIAIPALLILLQHDTGSALVFVGFILPFYREGLSGAFLIIGVAAIALFVLALLVNKYILMGVLAVVALLYLFVWLNKRSGRIYWRTIGIWLCCALFIFSVDFVFNNILESHQRERIDVLLGKTEDLRGSGYNVNQSKIAIGSGGFAGKGFLGGTLTKADFVPEQETDFIFCTVGEEWGWLGSSTLVALYAWLLLRLIAMAERQRSPFSRIYGYSVASILFVHLFVTVGMVLGLVPVIGIPLPFFSYGGSSLLAFTILLFIFIRQDASKNQLL